MTFTKNIQPFHYLTQDLESVSHQEQVRIALENGIMWVQLRVKDQSLEEWLRTAREVKSICDAAGAVLIINDSVEIAYEIRADGVHLGKNDMAIAKARTLLGKDMIIGGTANTMEDILQLQDSCVDYIGLGPYRFTETKKNLSAPLGLQGYASILSTFNKIPVIAIGGVTPNDVQQILKSGVHGVAVSSAINLSQDKPEAIRKFLHFFPGSFTSR